MMPRIRVLLKEFVMPWKKPLASNLALDCQHAGPQGRTKSRKLVLSGSFFCASPSAVLTASILPL